MRCKALMLADLLNTLNMRLRSIENFLRAFEVREFWGNSVFFSCWTPKKCQEILMVSRIYFIFCCNVFTTLIQCALYFCDVNEHFIYSHCIRRLHRKFLHHFEVTRLLKKSQITVLNLNYTRVTFWSNQQNVFLLP